MAASNNKADAYLSGQSEGKSGFSLLQLRPPAGRAIVMACSLMVVCILYLTVRAGLDLFEDRIGSFWVDYRSG